ncbi:MAG: YfcE family phosphodiesterase [Caldilineaceae bacterium]
MKIAILADAHGNQYGFHAALEDAKKKQADLIVSAGDMLASFPGGPEILDTLVSEQIPIVLGNADELLLKWWRSETSSHLRSSPQFRPLQTSTARLTDSQFIEIEQWPLIQLFEIEGKRVLLCHGTPDSNTRSIEEPDWSPLFSKLNVNDIDVIVAGHHHHQWSATREGVLLVLAGSCGMPCGGNPNAQYTILDVTADGIDVQHQTVEYDRKGFIDEINEQKYVMLASPIGWLELSQIITAQPLMKYYFRDRFNADKGTDVKHLSQTVRDLLDESDALDRVEAAFGPLVSY